MTNLKFLPVLACFLFLQSSFLLGQKITVTIDAESNIICNGGSVKINSTITGDNNQIFIYTWKTPTAFTGNKFLPSIDADVPGDYQLQIEGIDEFYFSNTETIIEGEAELSITPDGGTFCEDGNKFILSAESSAFAQDYEWDVPAGFSGDKTSQMIVANAPGEYSVSAQVGFCSAKSSPVEVSEVNPSISLLPTSPSSSGGTNGFLNVNVLNGTGPYSWQYAILNGASSSGSSSTEPFNITGLPAGNYSVTVSDANNCPSVSSALLLDPPCELSFAKEVSSPSCNNGKDGSVAISISGGTPPYSVSWSGPTSSGISTNSNFYTIQNLQAGTYGITVTGAKGCSDNMNAVLSNPPPISVAIFGDLVFCSEEGGTTLSTSPSSFKSYLWSTGTTGPSISVTSSGTYSVTVTNSSDCQGSASVSVLKLPPISISLNGSASMLSESCSGSCDGAIAINVTGGSEKSYSYSWSGPSGYSSSLEDISSLCPGKYDLTVEDSEGCVGEFSQIIGSVDPIELSLSSTNTSCGDPDGGSITASFSGGKSPYNISWSGPESGSTNNISSPHTISDLMAGTYTVTLTDSNDCSTTATRSISASLPFTFNAEELSPSCQGANTGSILVSNISGGTGPYTVIWVNSGGVESSMTTSSTNYTISGLASGTYTIIVKDLNGCDHTIASVVVGEQSEINVEIVGDVALCADQDEGVLTTNPTSFASWNWSTGATSISINIDNPGTYSVTVTDAGGCAGRNEITVTQASDISISSNMANSVLEVSCGDNCDGKISPNVSGGGASYDYSWTGPSGFNSSAAVIENLCAGTYTLVVKDENGCSNSYTQVIANSTDLKIELEAKSASCAGEKDGSASSEVSGGSAPYTYMWSNGASTADISSLGAGNYGLTVTDSKGCKASESVIVGEGATINGIVNPASSKICLGESVNLKASGGVSYLWSTGESTSSINVSPITTTEYFVTISGSSSACAKEVSAIVTVYDLSSTEIVISETSGLSNNDGEICEGSQVTLTATGGTSYIWQGGISNPLIVSPSSTETYAVTVTDANGCSKEIEETIIVNEKPNAAIDLSEANQVIGEGQLVKNDSEANCGSIVNCEWEIDNVTSSTSCGDQNFTFEDLGSYELALLVENSCGCVDETIQTIDIVPADGCKINLFSINNGLSEACVDQAIPVDFENVPTESCAILSSGIQVSQDGVLVDNYSFVNGFITFFEVGVYQVRYEIEDDCDCDRFVTREMNIVGAPEVSFADVNFLVGCAGEAITINLSGFDIGEKVTVLVDGEEKIYETDQFDVFLSEPGSYEISIVQVANQFCEIAIADQKLTIEIIEPLSIDQRIVTCDDDNGTYTLTLVTSGGEDGAFLNSSLGGIQNGDNLVIDNLDPNFGFQFNVWKGDFCNPIEVVQPVVSCNCLFNQGELNDEVFIDCAGEFFDISDLFIGTDANNPITDTLLYVLHDGVEERSLGTVYNMYPITQNFITNDFIDYIPNKRYTLSVVGIRKFDFFNLSADDFSVFDFRGEEDCFSVSLGVPVIWHGAKVSISGPSEVCENAYNEIFVSSGIGDGAEIDIVIPGLTNDNYAFDQTDGKLYVHFVSGTDSQVPIQITSTTMHQDIIRDELVETTCISSVDYDVNIDEAHSAPDTSGLILWPGGIFASKDTSENICYRWGKTTRVNNSLVEDTIFAGANDRFYYADLDDVEGLNERRQIWVETYFCDDTLCATRNIYNGLFPISLGVDLIESGMDIYPNPTDGWTNFSINNAYIGGVEILIYDIRGRQLVNTNFDKSGFVSKKSLDLDFLPSGMYVVRVVYGKEYSFIEKLIKR